mgnify:CR=1 FL=1
MLKKALKKPLPLRLVYTLLFISSLNLFAQLEAHLIENQGWVKGNYVEIGINEKGVFGTKKNNKPTSFHENREFSNLLFGFIANPKKDNWVDYDGDFFTPGEAEEGFSIEIDGINHNNNNVSFFDGVMGGIVSSKKIESDCFESLAQIIWEGSVDGLQIKRSYSVTENGTFIQMITSISNTSNDIKKNVFFMHNVDPDNNVSLSSVYATNLEILSQPSASDDIALVMATQDAVGGVEDTDGSAVSFYANDKRAKVSFGGFSNRSASNIWNGTTVTNTIGATTFDDIAMSISFNIGNIAPKETKNFVYYYFLKEVDKTFVPIIVNISTSNPTECNGNDGSLLLSGLNANEDYTISYSQNGTPIPEKTYTTDNLGNIEIANLIVGDYSDFKIGDTTCTSKLDTTYSLNPPAPLNPTFLTKNPTKCDGNDGSIILTDLNANENYIISYIKNGILIPDATFTTNSLGEIEIINLIEGDYSDFKITYKSCVTQLSSTHTLSPPTPLNPVFSNVNPTNCNGDDGTIIISGLTDGEQTVINYKVNGTAAPETIYTPNSAGEIALNNLSNGTFSDFSLEYISSSCSRTPSDIIVLNGTTPFTTTNIPDQSFCDINFDFITNIQLSVVDNIALGVLSSSEFSVSYHSSIDNANNSIDLDKNNYTTTGVPTYSLFAKIKNNTTGCYEIEPFIILINTPANFEIEDLFLCKTTDDNFITPEIDTNLDDSLYTFQWYLNDVLLPETTPNIFINTAGTYKVKATTITTGCSITEEAEVIPSGEPDKLDLFLNSELFANNHTITINALGSGNYIYRLNDEPFQESPVFENVPAGFNTFYVLDENGCGETSISKTIIDYPRFFTPNNDGSNDTWQIIGIEYLTNPTVQIANRFGKPLFTLTKGSKGWDGFYNGIRMPKNDYWFIVTYTNDYGKKQQVKSHFALIY